MPLSRKLGLFAMLAVLASHPALAQERVALVVGNGDYRYLTPLPTPANDAADLAVLLRLAEFEVIEAINVDRLTLLEHLDRFARLSRDADVALFFYAGHALQVSGRNYILPLGSLIERESDLDRNSVALDVPLGYMKEATLRLIIIDAAGENSIVTRAGRSLDVAEGLARPDITASGTLVMFADAESIDRVAHRRNGRLTEALLQQILAPGVDVRTLFSQVRSQVIAATASVQEPWLSESIIAPFYFVEPRVGDELLRGTPREVADILLWDQIKDSQQVREFENYLRRFPEGIYTSDARQRIEQLNIGSAVNIVEGGSPRNEDQQDQQSWERAQQVGTLDAYDNYLQNYPDGLYASTARRARRRLVANTDSSPREVAEIQEWTQIVRFNEGQQKLAALRQYVERYPDGLFADDAQSMIAELERSLDGEGEETLSPQETETLLGLSREQRRLIQSALNSLGYDAGPTDGIMGGRTRQAIRGWQESESHMRSGYLTRGQFSALISELFRECRECPKMVPVPAGSYTMGSSPEEDDRRDREGPPREVQIADFEVGQYEVTFAEWRACVEANACRAIPSEEQGPGDHPVVRISWEDAQAYVRWLSSRTNQNYRLLSESEWEYVIRADSQARFWYGDDPVYTDVCEHDNVADQSGLRVGGTVANCIDGQVRSAPVGSYQANPFEVYDLGGNVMEWVEDCFHGSYQGGPVDGSPWIGSCSDDDLRVVRGGSWRNFPRDSRSASRARAPGDQRYFNVGFRVAKTIATPPS